MMASAAADNVSATLAPLSAKPSRNPLRLRARRPMVASGYTQVRFWPFLMKPVSGPTSAFGLHPVAHGLDAVAVGVEQERGVVGRVVTGSQAGPPVAAPAVGEPGRMERFDGRAARGAQAPVPVVGHDSAGGLPDAQVGVPVVPRTVARPVADHRVPAHHARHTEGGHDRVPERGGAREVGYGDGGVVEHRKGRISVGSAQLLSFTKGCQEPERGHEPPIISRRPPFDLGPLQLPMGPPWVSG